MHSLILTYSEPTPCNLHLSSSEIRVNKNTDAAGAALNRSSRLSPIPDPSHLTSKPNLLPKYQICSVFHIQPHLYHFWSTGLQCKYLHLQRETIWWAANRKKPHTKQFRTVNFNLLLQLLQLFDGKGTPSYEYFSVKKPHLIASSKYMHIILSHYCSIKQNRVRMVSNRSK